MPIIHSKAKFSLFQNESSSENGVASQMFLEKDDTTERVNGTQNARLIVTSFSVCKGIGFSYA